MPSAWRVRVVEKRLESVGIRALVSERDVYALDSADRAAVLDVLVGAEASFPMVLVNGAVVCHGGVDLDAVARSLQQGPASAGRCC
ncbi:MAG: hypothetical protein JXA36_00525 [Coriobacteriia bacterium]|nr:hypothetical protein [Coriobacteriia bacterium]